jgi:5-methyltetrahydropteroyltriglutamate--homocysteine methyltransferase
MSSVPVKATIPGPMTISDSVADGFYYNEDKLSSDLVTAINHEIRTLAAAGCKHIQVSVARIVNAYLFVYLFVCLFPYLLQLFRLMNL